MIYKLQKEIPAIDVILGSHTHHLFREGHVVNDVQIAAAGKYGQYVGEVHLTIDEEKKKSLSIRPKPSLQKQ